MYRKMKDSGVEWIGQIPENWENVSLIRVLRERVTDGPHETPVTESEGIPFISVDSLNDSEYVDLKCVKKFISEELYNVYSNKTKLEDGDLLFSKSATIGKTAIVNTSAKYMIWSPLALLKPREKLINNKLLYYILGCNKYIEHAMLSGTHNTQANVGMRTLENTRIPLSRDLKLQHLLASYLDEKVAHIDNIIDKTKKTIEEYKKYKQSLITEAVTKGLNPDVKMKDSGVEWIGQIPEHWETAKLKYVFEIVKRISGELGYDVLSITQQGIKIKDIKNNEGQLSSDYSKYQFVNEGDYAMNHMDLLTGWVDLSKYSGVTSPDYRVFRLREEYQYSKEFYLYLFQICYLNRVFYGMGQGVSNYGRWRLQADVFKNILLPVPPCDEQIKIAHYISGISLKTDQLIKQKQSIISELASYKKSLIYEVVTGKREVY